MNKLVILSKPITTKKKLLFFNIRLTKTNYEKPAHSSKELLQKPMDHELKYSKQQKEFSMMVISINRLMLKD
jgi:hypothetical protein